MAYAVGYSGNTSSDMAVGYSPSGFNMPTRVYNTNPKHGGMPRVKKCFIRKLQHRNPFAQWGKHRFQKYLKSFLSDFDKGIYSNWFKLETWQKKIIMREIQHRIRRINVTYAMGPKFTGKRLNGILQPSRKGYMLPRAIRKGELVFLSPQARWLKATLARFQGLGL